MVVCDNCVDQLRKKRNEWIPWLSGEDVNSIDQQLTRMTWNITVYRMVAEAHRLAPDAEEGGKQLNGPVFRLLHLCFVESLSLGFRRLMENRGTEGPLGVYSLRSLLQDISQHAHLLTRETIVCLGPEDWLRERWHNSDEYLNDWALIRNEQIDQWVGVAEVDRSPRDQVPASLFGDRRKTLEKKFESVDLLVNKVIAHAATPDSRKASYLPNIPLDDLYNLHAELCNAAHFIGRVITDSGLTSFLPTPIYDQFQYLSRPIVADEDVPRLAQCWEELAAEYQRAAPV